MLYIFKQYFVAKYKERCKGKAKDFGATCKAKYNWKAKEFWLKYKAKYKGKAKDFKAKCKA